MSAVAVLGDPRRVLEDVTADASLLVLGSRGRGPVASRLLGSVAAAVSRHADCPVVICRPREHVSPSRGVAVGADGTAPSLAVVEFAFRQAAVRSLPLTIVHCVDGDRASDNEVDDEQEQRVIAESVAGFQEQYPEVEVAGMTVGGAPGECLATLADGWELIVVGRHPVDSVARRWASSVSTTVLEHAHTTVAVVPEA